MDKSKRIDFINILQVIGPILVILGHSLNGIPAGGLWYIFSKDWIYIFHMPYFFIMSGFLLSWKGWLKTESYGEFIRKKFVKLIIPYLVWNLAFLFPKYLAQSIIADEVTMSLGATLKIFLYPRQNIWGHTWFLVGLFILYCFAPLWKKILEKKVLTVILVLAGVALYMLPLGSEFLCISDLHKDALFFFLGCCLGTVDFDKLSMFMKKSRALLVIVAVLSSVAALFFIETRTFDWIPCLFIILSCWSLSMIFKNPTGIVNVLARRSFGIYILHWPSMLFARVLCKNILQIDTTITVIMMIACGYLIPNIIISLAQKIKIKPVQNLCRILIGS